MPAPGAGCDQQPHPCFGQMERAAESRAESARDLGDGAFAADRAASRECGGRAERVPQRAAQAQEAVPQGHRFHDARHTGSPAAPQHALHQQAGDQCTGRGNPEAQEPRCRAHRVDDVAGPIAEREAGEERAQPPHAERHRARTDADDGAQQEEVGLFVAQEGDETARRPFRKTACFGQHRQSGKTSGSGFHGPPAGRQRARDIDLACMKSNR